MDILKLLADLSTRRTERETPPGSTHPCPLAASSYSTLNNVQIRLKDGRFFGSGAQQSLISSWTRGVNDLLIGGR